VRGEHASPLVGDPRRLSLQETHPFGPGAATGDGDANGAIVPNPNNVAAGAARSDELDCQGRARIGPWRAKKREIELHGRCTAIITQDFRRPTNPLALNLVKVPGNRLFSRKASSTEIARGVVMARCPYIGRIGFVAAALVVLAASPNAQRNAGSGDWCADENWGNDRQGFCEVREYTVPASGGTLTVDAAPNGGITVEGSSRGDIAVQARVVATAATTEEAKAIASRVQVVATAVRVDADGPRNLGRRESWNVSYRLAVPTRTPLSLKTVNGGITVGTVDSRVDIRTTNGGVKLSHMAGDVEGRTTNGGIDVDLDGTAWNGGGLDLETTNGGVRMGIPAQYNAHLETGTQNGNIRIDFPITVQGTIGRSFSTDIGSGGATLRVRTSNGSVRITKK
jgi:hypothetical protein